MLQAKMTRENKLALVVGFALILVVGILISDHFSTARAQAFADLQAAEDPLAEGRPPDAPLLDLDRGNGKQPSADPAAFSAWSDGAPFDTLEDLGNWRRYHMSQAEIARSWTRSSLPVRRFAAVYRDLQATPNPGAGGCG